ncbi:hypothetical protein LL965_21785 [Xanthomonas cassavae CFBP 4642]|uniref:Uncharacterized protein n=1 Tax=Xanthomonas cassavae CFBP 4642 TaxID=1219375 RepID=A0ABS8HK50_9XANT|nr:hypothetical protein [Xanthomonas cassavae]MCC4622548.1 hypothetical protein [Xanthomonas cassavae CFBP 4642]
MATKKNDDPQQIGALLGKLVPRDVLRTANAVSKNPKRKGLTAQDEGSGEQWNREVS